MNALELHHPILSHRKLLSNIITFYSQEVVGQLHKVIGSADVLGNPVGLFNSVSSGVNDLFYEPIQGFNITRPGDFGIGIAKGSASLLKKTVFGFSDTLSKFTGSISKGLSVVTLDSEFQERRRVSGIRNKPRHAVYGVTQGFSSFARSVGSGVEGLVVCISILTYFRRNLWRELRAEVLVDSLKALERELWEL
jgi:vacuolar protein sorting-associated protein 13A/C